MDVIKRLNELRLERDLSVYRLAELSGINQSTLANTFSRGTVPSIKNLEMLCDTLGITLSQFFAEDDTPMDLSPLERKVIEAYRKLPYPLRENLASFIEKLPDSPNK